MGRPRKAAEQTTSTLYRGAAGHWHARVTMGRRPDGSTDRRHVQRRTKTELKDAVRELEHRRDTKGYSWTQGDPNLGDWLEHRAANRYTHVIDALKIEAAHAVEALCAGK